MKTIDNAATPTRIGTTANRKSNIAGASFLLPLLGVIALVAVVAGGGVDDFSPN